MDAGKPAGPLSGAGMQKMWKQLVSESWGFQSPEVTKGFHPGSVGRGGRRLAAYSDVRLSEKKENGILTRLPFQRRQAGNTTQTPGERGM